MRDVDADKRELTGESQTLHSQKPKLEQVNHNLPGHKNVDEELDKVWHEWKSVFDVIKDSIILIDGEFKIIQANLASSQLLGRPLDQIIGKTCWQLVHGTNEAPEECPLKRAKTTKKHEQTELYIPEKNIWIEASVSPVFDRQGNLSGAVHIIRDITDRKQVEELLRKERDKAQKYLDVAGVMFVAIDAEQRVGLINKKGCEILGYSEEEILGKNWFDNFLPERVRNTVRELSNKMLKGEIEVNEYFENPVLTKNREERLIGWHGVTLRDEKGAITCHLSSGEDITERKRAEEALKKAENEKTTILNTMSELVAYQDAEHRIIWANRAACESVGLTTEKLLGRYCYEIWQGRNKPCADCPVEKAWKTGRLEIEEIHSPDGRVWSIRANPVKNKSASVIGVVEITLDITERKKAEQKLIDYQTQLKSLASQLTLAEEHERRRLATELHDRISQSLVISKIKLDALRKSGRSRKLDKALENVCNSIGQTIQDTRTLTFNLGSPVLYELGFETAVSEWLTDQIQKKHGITVEFEDDGKPKPLDDDVRILLFRDVRELLTNIAKHAGAGKVKVSIRKVGSEIHISVEDDGRGFDTKKAAATAVRKGGFGLFSIRERLGQLGGHLEIESKPGCGTKATLIAPLKQEKVNRKRKK